MRSLLELGGDPLLVFDGSDLLTGDTDAKRCWYDDREDSELEDEMAVREVDETSAATASSAKRGAEPIVLNESDNDVNDGEEMVVVERRDALVFIYCQQHLRQRESQEMPGTRPSLDQRLFPLLHTATCTSHRHRTAGQV